MPQSMSNDAATEYAERLGLGGTDTISLDMAGALSPRLSLPCVYSPDGSGLGSTPDTMQGLLGTHATLAADTVSGPALLVGVGNMSISPDQNALFYSLDFLLLVGTVHA